ncbi:hypothetical protein [Mesobacillus maritimus]|uniref:Small, acid-soluble spore protein gamma-type n=1 Tax=Mesobacillus maritimus TaxID=1643336 RepID=A0ABS7K6V5_9BACI|nr:hypothetical protein [Mesobacillus maritimus]MBY0097986.1 hypothetical protein [Mesobacillus maritimus]
MKQHRQTKGVSNSIMKPEFSGTDPQQVKQEIQRDVQAGQGAMTSREAGAMRD